MAVHPRRLFTASYKVFLASLIAASVSGPAHADGTAYSPPALNPAAPAPAVPMIPDVQAAAQHSQLLNLPVSENSNALISTSTLTNPPIVQWLLANNVQLTPLGEAGGLQGWLATKNGHQQVIYITPDGKHMVAGVMGALGGEDVTELQITAMTLGHNPMLSEKDMAPATTSNNPSSPQQPFPPAATQSVPQAPATTASPAIPSTPALPSQASQASSAGASAPYGQPNALETGITPDHLGGALDRTAYFTVGQKGKPDLVMIADPNCPFCHASWSLLQPLVQEGKIDVSVVMIDMLNGSHEKALDLLSNSNIGTAWEEGQGSRQGVPVEPMDAANLKKAEMYLAANEKFAANMNLFGTPTLFWVARNAGKTSPFRVYRGLGLAGVGGFLTAVEQGNVATING